MVRGLTSDSDDSDAPPPRPVVKKKPKRRYSAADPLATSESEDDERPPPRPVAKKKKPAPAPAEAPKPVQRKPEPAKRKPAPTPKPPPKRKKPTPPAADDEEKELQTKTATAAVALWCRVKDLEEKKKRLKRVFDKLPKALADAAKEALKRKESAEEADAKAAAAAADAAMAALRAADEPEAFDELAEPENPVAGDAADEPVATLRGPVSASVLAALTAPAPAVAEAPSAGTASVLPKNIVECVLIKRKAELLGALDIKSLSAVFQTSSTLAALADDASTWHRVYAARRAAPRAAPDAGLAMQTEEQDYAPLIPAPFGGGGGGGGGAMMDDDDVQLMAAPAAAPVHAMMMNVDDEEAPAEPEPGLTTVDEAIGGHDATAAAKKALLRAEDVTEEALGEDPGDAHVMLSVTNASAGRPRALEAGVYGASDEERAALDKVLEPAGVRSSFKSPGASSGPSGPQYRPEDAEQIFNDAGGGMAGTLAIEAAIEASKGGGDDDEGLPPLIFEDPNGVVKPEKKAVVRITFRGQRDRDNEVPPDLDLAIAIKECSLELKDQDAALEAIKDDLRQWENATFKVENGTVKVGRWTPPQHGPVLEVNKDLWWDALDDAQREAVIRAGFVRMMHAKKEHMRLTVKEASAAPYALDSARNNGRVRVAATIQGKTVRGEACRYDAYESS